MPTSPLGLPIGGPVPGWTPRPRPPHTAMTGRYCSVEPLDTTNLDRHAASLFAANRKDESGRHWTYFNYGPFDHLGDFRAWLSDMIRLNDPFLHAIVDRADNTVGVAAFMRIDPENGVMEVGHVHYSPDLQHTAAGTEAMFLMMRRAFNELGYRRYEWKCDSLNAASRRAAERYGFTFEGIFRNATVYKDRSRDTAWFSIIDTEWPARQAAFEAWLRPENFDADGRQRQPLARP